MDDRIQKTGLKIGVLISHPIQYLAPLLCELAREVDLKVYYAHRLTAKDQVQAGYNVAFEWDIDLLSGYDYQFLQNRARQPGPHHFLGCDTPEIADEVRNGGFDCFLVFGWHLKSYWQAIFACRSIGVPLMVRGDSHLETPRGLIKKFLKRLIYPRMLRLFDAILYVGQKNLEYLKSYEVPDERLFFAPHCVDNHRFSNQASRFDRDASRARMGIAPGEKTIVFVGRLTNIKRPLDMVEALHILRQRGYSVHGVFAGDGPLRSELESRSYALDVPVEFLGFCNQAELPRIYAAGDVLVLPSGGETWGLVVNEALASGTRVVVSDAVGCAPDLVFEGKTGACYPVGNTRALADALECILLSVPDCEAIQKKMDQYSICSAVRGIVRAGTWVASVRS